MSIMADIQQWTKIVDPKEVENIKRYVEANGVEAEDQVISNAKILYVFNLTSLVNRAEEANKKLAQKLIPNLSDDRAQSAADLLRSDLANAYEEAIGGTMLSNGEALGHHVEIYYAENDSFMYVTTPEKLEMAGIIPKTAI